LSREVQIPHAAMVEYLARSLANAYERLRLQRPGASRADLLRMMTAEREAKSSRPARVLDRLFDFVTGRPQGLDDFVFETVLVDPRCQEGIRPYEHDDVTRTTFMPNTSGAVACLSVVVHGVDLGAYCREAARLLKPGGIPK